MQLQMSESPHYLLSKTESLDQLDSFPESSNEIALVRVSVDPNPNPKQEKKEEKEDPQVQVAEKTTGLNFPPTHCSNGSPRPHFILLIISMEQKLFLFLSFSFFSFFFYYYYYYYLFFMFLIHLGFDLKEGLGAGLEEYENSVNLLNVHFLLVFQKEFVL